MILPRDRMVSRTAAFPDRVLSPDQTRRLEAIFDARAAFEKDDPDQ